MTPAKLYIPRLSPFSPILGKWESGESVGKVDSCHACHNATNGMMAGVWLAGSGAGYLVMPLPALVAVLAIGGSDTAGIGWGVVLVVVYCHCLSW